jgi:hypothetical protein
LYAAAPRFGVPVVRPGGFFERIRDMSKATYPLKLPLSLKETAARLEREDGVSLNQWIAAAVAQKVGAVETAESFLRQRAAGATGAGVRDFLAHVPGAPPQIGGELDG